MDLIQALSGEGTGIAKSKKTHVEYELGVFEHLLTVGNDKTVPELKQIHGWIRPVFGKKCSRSKSTTLALASFPSRTATAKSPPEVGSRR